MTLFEFNPLEVQFLEALALIVAACFVVPVFKRIGLGTILGYLATGILIGATLSLGFTKDPENLLHFAEFGVVLFLFVIGLELVPSKLWAMRGDILGLGFAQMVLCGAALTAAAVVAGVAWPAAIVVGLGLALSSTALVLQTLGETGERDTAHGRKSFSVLLFQDLAIVPLLLIVQLMAPSGREAGLADGLAQVGIAIVAIGILVAAGRYLLNPVFRILANTGVPEIMTAFALGIVIAAALLMDMAGMSYAMGAFVAGVMLAESSYRHEVEADIEPFRGLFLGLFFVAVGVSLDLGSVARNWLLIVVAVPVTMALKTAVTYAILRAVRTGHDAAVRAALGLSQSGEFGFVMFAAAAAAGVLAPETSAVLVAVVTVSMALSPLALRLAPLLVRARAAETLDEDFDGAGGRALVIGFGRFGQIASQPLRAQNIRITVIDNDAERVREAARFGYRIYFGDGTRRDVLRAAGAGEAGVIVICVDDPAVANRIVRLVQSSFPHARVFVRSYDRNHSIELLNLGVDLAVRETFASAMRMGAEALRAVGIPEEEVAATVEALRERDARRLRRQVEEAAGGVTADARAARVTAEPL